MKKVLTIAGSDPSGGAGIQADLKTIAALGCYGMSAITAVTVQNTLGVSRVFPLPPDLIEQQISAVLSDVGADAIKIGMLHDKECILAVERALACYSGPIVLDPVLSAKGGAALFHEEDLYFLKRFFSRVLLVTPNALEAEKLGSIETKNILIKGGHMKQPDLLFSEDQEIARFETAWIDTRNTHGTGCTYASAIAAYLAQGFPLIDAIEQAKTYLHGAIAASAFLDLGHGHGSVHHFWREPCMQ
jgi:hydroxymethylpyrimidine/phosphomethylpyrimidine kinase